ncbi:hypothetical protein, partial [Shewanella sp. 10N.286.54.B9]|uniref:hypothetical protein n=1 Tax=Shewanella sp. 10N.286.54.B9 TaxID=3229719 RepID=UPI0035503ED4
MKKLALLFMLTTGSVMACDSASNSSKAKVSKPASETQAAEKTDSDDIHLVPNQFPLEDGVLPKQENKENK